MPDKPKLTVTSLLEVAESWMRISAVDEASEMDEVAKANPMTGKASLSEIV